MNEYIFYTSEGHTEAPNENVEVENCQVLGCSHGIDKCEAQENLLKENPWIVEAGFDPAEFIVRQVVAETRTYQVEIIETNCRVESIEAKSPQDAREKIKQAYMEGKLVLNDDNSHMDVDFHIV